MSPITSVRDTGSLRSRVFATLEKDIINGVYKEGEALSEIKLSQTLGVSRTPIREALMQLELEGLVETIQNKGAVVVGISAQDIEDIYAIRLHIEGFAASLAAKLITEEELAELEEIVELQEFFCGKSDTDNVWELDARFHNLIYAASKNRSLGNTLRSFHNQVQHGRDLSLHVNGRREKSVHEHRLILEAIKAHDEKKASDLMTEHLEKALENFRLEVASTSYKD